MTIDKGILIRNIYYMLTYAFQSLRQNNYAEIAGESFDNIQDLFAEILYRGVSWQLKQGLHREYVVRGEPLPTIRGKINMPRTIGNLVQKKQHIHCEFDELTENNLFNQILKTTITLLIRHIDVQQDRKVALKKLVVFFSNVDLIDTRMIRWDALRFDRNSRTYQMLLYICYFVLDGLIMTTESGQYKMKEFSDDHMCRLFEKFVLEYYRKTHPELNPRAAQIEWNIDKESSSMDVLPIMQTDITLSFPNRTLIIDTKYYSRILVSHMGKNQLHTNNLYQINTYVFNMDVTHSGTVDGMLLYAKTDEAIAEDTQSLWRDGNIIYIRTLDLNQPFDAHSIGIKQQLEKLITLYLS